MENGQSVAYALWNLEERGRMFIGPQADVYTGMIIGEHTRGNDLNVNVTKEKHLTNHRASGADEKQVLAPPRKITLESAMEFIDDDELIEITPQHLRLRKRFLDHNLRKRKEKEAAARAAS